jgi:hypothetical protein
MTTKRPQYDIQVAAFAERRPMSLGLTTGGLSMGDNS